jgi:glycosyltransferase involved in cell wall biosynthesis
MTAMGVRVDVLQAVEWSPPPPLAGLYAPWRAARAHRGDLLDELDGVAIHHPSIVTPRPSRFFAGDSWSRHSRAIARYCAERPELARADVVLGHFMVPDGVHALELVRALGIPVASLAWGDDLHAWPERSEEWRERLVTVLRGIDLPLACSRRLADDGNAWLPAPRDDWQVVYGGIDLDEFSPTTDRAPSRSRALGAYDALLGENVRIMLMVGQPVREKGYFELLDAWTAVHARSPEWHLVMLGGRGDLDVESMIRERSLEGCAHWIGLQPVQRMPDLMRSADAFVLPSYNEGLSLSVLEALATGVPTVATDVGGHAEVIRSASEGWLIPPADVDALRSALLEVTTLPDERARRGAAGRRAAERIGSPADNAARLIALLTGLRAGRLPAALVAT